MFIVGVIILEKFGRIGILAVSAVFMTGFNITTALADTSVSQSVQTATGTSTNSAQTPQQQVKLSSADVIRTVKQLFPTGFRPNQSVTADLQTDFMDSSRMVYQVNTMSLAVQRQSGPNLQNDYAHATVDANTGQILSFQNTYNDWLPAQPVDVEKAQQIASAWLGKLAPQQASELTLEPSSGPLGGGYSFLFVRKVNGVPVPFQRAEIDLDVSGDLVLYNFSWHDAVFPDVPVNVIGQVAATQKYESGLHLQLHYQQQYNRFGVGPMQLVYQPHLGDAGSVPQSETIIDAVTGVELGGDGQPAKAEGSATFVPLVANGPTQWPKPGSPLSQAQLEQQVRQQFGLTGDDWTLNSPGQMQNTGGPFASHVSWQYNFLNQKSNQQIGITIDATDGVITQYNSYQNSLQPASGAPLTDVQLQQHADDLVQKLFPNLTGAIARDTQQKVYGPTDQSYFSYDFLINGVPLYAFQISVSKATGQVQSYNLDVDPGADYPPSNGAVSQQSAEEAYVKRDPVELQYLLPAQVSQPDKPYSFTYGDQAQLVYTGSPMPYGPGTLNAITGEWLTLTPFGLPDNQLASLPTGSPVEQAIALLQQHGVIQLNDGKLNPTAPVTRAQFVRWLTRGYNMNIGTNNPPQFPDVPSDNPYASDISEALMQGWLPAGGDFHPNSVLTRVQAADWLVHWMGWNGPATNPSLFKLPYRDAKDVPSAEQGPAAIAVVEGMIPLSNGMFDPNAPMTIGDAAVAILHAAQTVMKSSN